MRTVEFATPTILNSHGPLVDALVADYGPIGTAVLAFGILGDRCPRGIQARHALAIVRTDYVAQISLLTIWPRPCVGRAAVGWWCSLLGGGVRVRRANYVYGSAKAGLDGFASGLADALHGSGVSLLIVRPGS